MAPKKQLVKLKLPPDFLKTLPVFATPKIKRVKKIAEEKKNDKADKNISPAPHEDPLKINTGSKELSTAGLTVHSVNANFALDKSGRPAKKWVRGTRQFKTFSGFKVKIKTWKHKNERPEKEKPAVKAEAPQEESGDTIVQKQEDLGLEAPSEASAIAV